MIFKPVINQLRPAIHTCRSIVDDILVDIDNLDVSIVTPFLYTWHADIRGLGPSFTLFAFELGEPHVDFDGCGKVFTGYTLNFVEVLV